jgi:O-antigen/teichoic acid export membrane protein
MSFMLNRLYKIIQKNELDQLFTHHIARQTTKVFFIQSFGILLALISNFWIARLLNASGYGQFSFIITIINLLSMFACLGFTSFLIRNVAEYSTQNKFAEIKGLMRFSYLISAISALLFFSGFVMASHYDLLPVRLDVFTTINIGVSILAGTLLLLRQFTLQSLNHTSESRIINDVIRYAITILLLFIYVEYFFHTIDTYQVIFINTISLVLALILIEIVVKKVISKDIKQSPPVFHARIWFKTSMVLFVYKLMFTYLMSSEIILLGFLREGEEVGVYSIARKVSAFISFGLTSSNIVLGPKIAKMYAENNLPALQKLLRKSTRVVFIFSLFTAVVLIIISFPLFRFLGDDYKSAYIPLLIMMVGELVNVACGPVANLLINSNQEKYANISIFITLVFNITCNLVLIYFYGYIGAAITTALSVILWNSLMAVGVRKKIGIKSWVW